MSESQNNSVQIYRKLKRYFLERGIANYYEFLITLDDVLEVRQQELSKNSDIKYNDLKNVENEYDHRKELIILKVEAEKLKGLTNLLRQSFLTSLYSFMELWLMRECYLDSKRRDGGKSYKSIYKEKGIKKSKEIFCKYYEKRLPFWFESRLALDIKLSIIARLYRSSSGKSCWF